MDDRIFKLLAQLRKDDPLSAVEVADLLWFATQMRRKDTRDELPPQPQPPKPRASGRKPPIVQSSAQDTTTPPKEPPQPAPPSASLTPAASQTASGIQGLPFNVPAAQAIQNRRAIARALRPLNRKTPSRTKQVIDTAATINRVAEERLLIPVLKSAPERWFDVVLVIEKTTASGIWQQTIKELEQILLHQGAFRDVRCWSVKSHHGQLQLQSRQGSPRHRRELIRVGQQRLIFILSDCLDITWQNGQWHDWCKLWGKYHPVTVLQMLPSGRWSQTRLGNLEPVWLSSVRSGLLNHQWHQEPVDSWDESQTSPSGFVVPLLMLDPYGLRVWAQGIAGQSEAQLLGYMLEPSVPSSSPDPEPQRSAQERFEQFIQDASPPAKRLAALMSAVPVQLPIVRLIQRTMLRQQTNTTHIAEVFLSGILERQQPHQSSNPEKQLYRFYRDDTGDIRTLLNATLPKSELANVITHISADIAQRAGTSISEFKVMLRAPEQAPTSELAMEVSEFARVSLDVLKRLGGDYAAFAESLERGPSPPVLPQHPDEWQSPELTIEPYAYEAVTLEVSDIESRMFTFHVATVGQQNTETIDILIIDDDPAIQLLLKRTLKKDYSITVASNGAEGLEIAQQIHPAMIICDWIMPGMDGIEVCQQIKAIPELSTTFFILLTSKGALEDRVHGLDAGADDFLCKPIEMFEVEARVRAAFRIHQKLQSVYIEGQDSELISQVRQNTEQENILIIDDDPAIQLLLRRTLATDGYSVVCASNGAEGLELAQQIHPVMIICDWIMPGMDGIEVCQRIKAIPELSTAFFIMLTSKGVVEDRVYGLDAGADDFLCKPIEMFELRARVRSALRLHQQFQNAQSSDLIGRTDSQTTWVIHRQKREAPGFVQHLNDEVDLELIEIPAGRFVMGDARDDETQPIITLDSFYLGRYPITQAQWRVVAGWDAVERDLEPEPAQFKDDFEQSGDRWLRPVERVSWLDAVEFCQRLSRETGLDYRLPSEAQWEYACRAVGGGELNIIDEERFIAMWNRQFNEPFHFGQTLMSDIANYDASTTYNDGPEGEYRRQTTPVSYFGVANSFGLSEMHGNVWEWCADEYQSGLEHISKDGAPWSSNDDSQESKSYVLRGGSWFITPRICRSAFRVSINPDVRHYDFGFRVLCARPRTP